MPDVCIPEWRNYLPHAEAVLRDESALAEAPPKPSADPPLVQIIGRNRYGAGGGWCPVGSDPRAMPEQTVTVAPRPPETDADGVPLVAGAFYWAKPVYDVDYAEEEGPDHWDQDDQPARFNGYRTDGAESWTWLGVENLEWPACWIGKRIPDAP